MCHGKSNVHCPEVCLSQRASVINSVCLFCAVWIFSLLLHPLFLVLFSFVFLFVVRWLSSLEFVVVGSLLLFFVVFLNVGVFLVASLQILIVRNV